MKKTIIPVIIILLLVVVGGIFWAVTKKAPPTQQEQVVEEEQLAVADSSIEATVTWSKTKDNTVVLSVNGLKGGYTKVAYEISYDSQGIVQGVTSRPLDIVGQETFTRDDIYLGTCSKNVCKPHTGVKKVSLVLEFTDTAGKKSQLTKDFDL